MATEKPRYTVSVDNDLFKQIEDFRFLNRYQSRAEATVELIRLGLEALEEKRNADSGSKQATNERTVDQPPRLEK